MRQNERGDGRRWKMGGRHDDREKFEVKEKTAIKKKQKKYEAKRIKMHNGGDIKKTRRGKRKMNE